MEGKISTLRKLTNVLKERVQNPPKIHLISFLTIKLKNSLNQITPKRTILYTIFLFFSLLVSPISGSANIDFQQIPTTTVTFLPRETGRKVVIINIIDDEIVENNEQFQVFITSSDADTRVLTSTATVTILDDDCKFFSFHNLVISIVSHFWAQSFFL